LHAKTKNVIDKNNLSVRLGKQVMPKRLTGEVTRILSKFDVVSDFRKTDF